MKTYDPTDADPRGNFFKYDNLQKFRCGWNTTQPPPETRELHCITGKFPFEGEWTMRTKVADNKVFKYVPQALCADKDAKWKTVSSNASESSS